MLIFHFDSRNGYDLWLRKKKQIELCLRLKDIGLSESWLLVFVVNNVYTVIVNDKFTGEIKSWTLQYVYMCSSFNIPDLSLILQISTYRTSESVPSPVNLWVIDIVSTCHRSKRTMEVSVCRETIRQNHYCGF